MNPTLRLQSWTLVAPIAQGAWWPKDLRVGWAFRTIYIGIKNHFNDVTPLDEIFLAQASCSSLLLKPLAQVSGPSLLLEFLRGSTCLMAENLPAWATQFHFVFLTMDEYRNRYMVLTEMERWRRIAKRCHLRLCDPNRGQSVTNIYIYIYHLSRYIYRYLYL